MTKMMKLALAAALTTIASGSALAGLKATYGTQVDNANRHAWGALGSARNSADSVQYIGCSVSSYADGTESAWCGARDANYVFGSCTTFNPTLINQIRSLKGDSYLNLYWDASYACTQVDITNMSYMAPKAL